MGLLPKKYNLTNLRRALGRPRMLVGEAAELGVAANQRYHALRGYGGFDVVGAEWDTLVILDACRYDRFVARSDLPGETRPVVSRASESTEFLRANFSGTFHDTVYVTTNPHSQALPEGTFHFVDPLYATAWDDALGTVRPEVVTDAAIAAHERFPDKRLVVHYMQPHAPYIGEFGLANVEHNWTQDADEAVRAVWTNLRYGLTDTDIDDVRRAYDENLDLVLADLPRLLAALDGKAVVTADHGELLGERLRPLPVRGYGHPAGIRAPGLVRVPWHEPPHEGRRTVRADPPVGERTDLDADDLEDRLAALGYR